MTDRPLLAVVCPSPRTRGAPCAEPGASRTAERVDTIMTSLEVPAHPRALPATLVNFITMRCLRSLVSLVVLVAAASGAVASALGDELLVNGNAEAGTTAGWITTSVQAVPASDAGTQGLPPGATVGDWSFAAGAFGSGGLFQGLRQTADVTAWSGLIDAWQSIANLSFLVQAREPSTVSVGLVALDANGAALVFFPAPAAVSTPGVNDWSAVALSTWLPSGTRALEVSVVLGRLSGSSNAFADNFSLTLSAVPEPGSSAMMALGLGWFALLAWRRHKALVVCGKRPSLARAGRCRAGGVRIIDDGVRLLVSGPKSGVLAGP